MNKKEINIRGQLVTIERRQQDIEFCLKNRNYNPAESEWVEMFSSWQAEYKTNAEKIGHLTSELKLIKLEQIKT
jgi:hypothetical protein